MHCLRIGLVLLFCCSMGVVAGPTVNLPGMGIIEGRNVARSTISNRRFNSFKGIPFGKPPSGPLRYKASEMADPWEGTLETKRYGRACPQSCPLGPNSPPVSKTYKFWKNFHDFMGDNITFAEMDLSNKEIDYEDCLYTHVYTPTLDENAKLPVMVFYYGGSFEYGSAAGYLPNHFMDYDVVVVVPHYRLGALGFLSMQNEEVPGNAAMLDQVLALEWVNQYIQYFGGDPENVIIFGESAGAASVSLLALSPLTKGLMKGIIAESGAAFAEWAIDRDPVYNAYGVAEQAGCDMTSEETINACFMNSDPCTILSAQDSWSNSETKKGLSGFGAGSPTVQTAGSRIFIDKNPRDIWLDPEFVAVPSIYGANKHEGTYVLGIVTDDYMAPNDLLDDQDFLKYEVIRPFFTMFGITDNGNVVTDSVEYEYVGVERLGNMTAMAPGLIDFGGSTFLKAPGYESNIRHAKFGNSYQYAYNFFGRLTYPICSAIVGTEYVFPPGICHAAEIIMLFGNSVSFAAMSPEEQALSQKMVKMWYNFAKYLNPTPPENPVEGVEIWPPYDEVNQYYLRFDDEITVQRDYKTNEYTIAKEENFGLN